MRPPSQMGDTSTLGVPGPARGLLHRSPLEGTAEGWLVRGDGPIRETRRPASGSSAEES